MQNLKKKPVPLQNLTLTSASTFFSPHPSIRLEQSSFPSVEQAECDTLRLFQGESIPSDSDQAPETDPLNSTLDQSFLQSRSFILGPRSSDVQSLCSIIDNLSRVLIDKNQKLKHYQSKLRPLRSVSMDYTKPAPATPRDGDLQLNQIELEIDSAVQSINSISIQEDDRKQNLSYNIKAGSTKSGIRDKAKIFQDINSYNQFYLKQRRETMPSSMGKRILKEMKKDEAKKKKRKNAGPKYGKRSSKLTSSFYSERMDASDTMMKMINLDNPLGPEVEEENF